MPSPVLGNPSSVKGLPQPGHGARHLLLLSWGPEEEAAHSGLAACLLSAVAKDGLHRWTLRGTHGHPPGSGLRRSGWPPAPGDIADPFVICPLPVPTLLCPLVSVHRHKHQQGSQTLSCVLPRWPVNCC